MPSSDSPPFGVQDGVFDAPSICFVSRVPVWHDLLCTCMKHSNHKRNKRRHRPHVAGLPPGTVVVDPDAPKPVIRVMAYNAERYTEATVSDPAELAPYLKDWETTWVNVDGLGDAQVIQHLGALFKLHGLALEDVVNLNQRPKVDTFGDVLFIVARMIRAGPVFETEQVSLFLGAHFVLTFQEAPGDCLEAIRQRIRKKLGRVRESKADYLAYAILDAVVDEYFPVLEEFGERLEHIEEDILADPLPELMPRMRVIKRELMALRRAIWPQRETVNALIRDPLPHVSADTRVYLRDCYDHTIRIIDLIENYRELSSDLMDVYLSSIGQRTNDVMKTLTVVASIFIPLTFIAGIYGMNFDIESSPWNMPELYWRWGYPAVLAGMALLGAGMLYAFRRRGWLGAQSPK